MTDEARVHLWFGACFGESYGPHFCAAEALQRFVAPAFAIGARLEEDDTLTIIAPFGLEDLLAMRLRPNPARPSAEFASIAAALAGRWPELSIEG